MWREMLQAWRYRLFLATRMADFGLGYLERSYRIYLNHSKVIHYRDGYPVFSLTTPSLFSPPFANFTARVTYRAIQNRPLPNVMSFAVGDTCNARCAHCSFFERIAAEGRDPLSTAQCQDAIRQAQSLGVSVIQLLGGEPLMREDLPDIIRSVDGNLSITVMFTNGWLLGEKVKELRKSGLDSVFISLDAPTPKAHDKSRDLAGLFDRAIIGIQQARSLGMSTGISCVVTPQSVHNGDLDDIISLGKQIGVHEVLVLQTVPVGRCQVNSDTGPEGSILEELMGIAGKYNSETSYPGVTLYPYISSWRSVGCSGGTSYFYLTPYGDVCPCDANAETFGNIVETPLHIIWDQMTSAPTYGRSGWQGCRMRNQSKQAQVATYAMPHNTEGAG
jgi:MoaA/NifB/PqqE/SkfB family radical SAM enzyme